jgi:ATP-dependent Clp protease protease subunit
VDRFQEENLEQGHITLFGEVDDALIQGALEQLFYLEGKPDLKEITLWINSDGGLLQAAFGMADIMELIKTPIRTVGLGSVESAATVLLASGTPGRRFLTRNASVMVHEYSWANSGSVTEMKGRMVEIQNTSRKQLAHLVRTTGKSERKVRELLRHEETWLRPEQAVTWGLVDAVLAENPFATRRKRGKKLPKKTAGKKSRKS